MLALKFNSRPEIWYFSYGSHLWPTTSPIFFF